MLLQEGPDTEQLRRGVLHFRRDVFPRSRELYESLAEKQVPYALFLTCGDSRIDPTALTSSAPGQIFVERTPGNIVPIYSDVAAVGVSASIEYSVIALGVSHIIVCGHSACGAMKALLEPEELQEMPATARWLKYAEAPMLLLNQSYRRLEEKERLKRLSQLNVIEQMVHLSTHPAVDGRVRNRSLTVHGWYYEIHTGKVEAYNPENGLFEAWE